MPGSGARGTPCCVKSQPIEVILVDDEPDIRFMLRIYLGRLGFEIEGEARNGAEAALK